MPCAAWLLLATSTTKEISRFRMGRSQPLAGLVVCTAEDVTRLTISRGQKELCQLLRAQFQLQGVTGRMGHALEGQHMAQAPQAQLTMKPILQSPGPGKCGGQAGGWIEPAGVGRGLVDAPRSPNSSLQWQQSVMRETGTRKPAPGLGTASRSLG